MLSALHAFGGKRLYTTLGIVVLAAIAEAFGLILLLPVAEIIFADGNDKLSGFSQKITGLLINVGAGDIQSRMLLLSAGFMIIICLRGWLLLVRDRALMSVSQGFVDHIRTGLISDLAHADWPTVKSLRRANMLDSLTTNIGRIAIAMRFLSQSTIAVVIIATYLVAAFAVSSLVGLLLLCLVLVAALFAAVWIGRSARLGKSMTKGSQNIAQETTRFLDGLKAAKACQAEEDFISRFSAAVGETRKISISFAMAQGKLRRIVEIVGAVFGLTLLFAGYWWVGLSPTELLVAGAILVRLVPSLLGSLTGVQSMAYAISAYAVADQLRAEARENMGESSSKNEGKSRDVADDWQRGIQLSSVTITADGQSEGEVLVQAEQVNVAASGITLLAGPSGAGKSSLAEAIAGLSLPVSGRISAGEMELNAAVRARWQSRISFAPQEPFLFSGSVRENLCWPNINANDDAIWAALDSARAKNVVSNLPSSLDHPLLDGGARLSGGERQRISLARALLRPSSLLILDETFSSVDAATEARILDNLKSLSATKPILLISHGSLAVSYADQIVDVDAGKAIMRL